MTSRAAGATTNWKKYILDSSIEEDIWRSGINHIAGVDEAGRGPLAGPVVAAAVILDPGDMIEGVNDSKKLSPSYRELLFEQIVMRAKAYAFAVIPADEIDRINIFQATMLAMQNAVRSLAASPGFVLVDGTHFRDIGIPYKTLVNGDARCRSIAAASIVAKVTRDRIMVEMESTYPGYGFARNKGYGTPEHLRALSVYGPCGIHRRSFRLHSPQWSRGEE